MKYIMARNKKIIITIIVAVVAILAWSPWLDNQSLHDKVFEERAKIDGTIDEYTNELICDYNVRWVPFGRYIASCEGGYFTTFWGQISYPEPVEAENPCVVCLNGCDACPEGCDECLIGIEKKLKDPNMKWYYNPDIPSWKSYRDERLGYEMKYPPIWSIAEERKDFGIELSRIVFQSKDYKDIESEEYKERVEAGEETGLLQPMVMAEGIKLEFLITEIPPDFKWQDWAERATDYPYGKLVSERFLTLEGKEVYERQVESEEVSSIVISFPDLKETRLFELILHTLKKDEDKNSAILKQIISIFRFLE